MQIAKTERKSNPRNEPFDEDNFIGSLMDERMAIEKQKTKRQSTRYFSNKRCRDKAKQRNLDAVKRSEELEKELVEKDLTIAEQNKKILELKDEIELLRREQDDDQPQSSDDEDPKRARH